MNVKIIDNFSRKRKTKLPASVGMSFVTGCCSISKTAQKLTRLKVLDKIVFVQNEEDERDWYFRLAFENEDGFNLRSYSSSCLKKEHLLFNSANLVGLIADSLSFIGSSAKCNISNELVYIEGVPHWQLITGMIKNK